MKEIIGFYSETGNFETYTGNILIINDNIILPIYNSQLSKHPLNNTENIVYLEFCYYLFRQVLISKRDIYKNDKEHYLETNYFNIENQKEKTSAFLLELIDYNSSYQYWNWEIVAKSFSIIVDNNFKICYSPFKTQTLNKYFEINHFEVIKSLIF